MIHVGASPGYCARKHYAFVAKEMTELAEEAEKQRKTILAGRLRHGARIVKRAAIAEQLNPEPPGIGELS